MYSARVCLTMNKFCSAAHQRVPAVFRSPFLTLPTLPPPSSPILHFVGNESQLRGMQSITNCGVFADWYRHRFSPSVFRYLGCWAGGGSKGVPSVLLLLSTERDRYSSGTSSAINHPPGLLFCVCLSRARRGGGESPG